MVMNHLITVVTEPTISHEPLAPVAEHEAAVAGALEFDPVAGANVGIWEMPPGVAKFDDEEELFVVISGAATLTFLKTAEKVEIGPGSIVRLYDGQETLWEVRETIRKVYVSV